MAEESSGAALTSTDTPVSLIPKPRTDVAEVHHVPEDGDTLDVNIRLGASEKDDLGSSCLHDDKGATEKREDLTSRTAPPALEVNAKVNTKANTTKFPAELNSAECKLDESESIPLQDMQKTDTEDSKEAKLSFKDRNRVALHVPTVGDPATPRDAPSTHRDVLPVRESPNVIAEEPDSLQHPEDSLHHPDDSLHQEEQEHQQLDSYHCEGNQREEEPVNQVIHNFCESEEEELPFPGFSPKTFYYFHQKHPLRVWSLRCITWPYPFVLSRNAFIGFIGLQNEVL